MRKDGEYNRQQGKALCLTTVDEQSAQTCAKRMYGVGGKNPCEQNAVNEVGGGGMRFLHILQNVNHRFKAAKTQSRKQRRTEKRVKANFFYGQRK